MRGNQDEQGGSYIPLEKRVPQDHPLRRVGEMTDRGLQELSGWFDQLYAQMGRPAISAEQRLRAHITGVRALGVVSVVAEFKASKNWKNSLNEAERQHPRFASSQRSRRRVERVFSSIKMVAGQRQTKLRGRGRIDWLFRLTAAAHNLVKDSEVTTGGSIQGGSVRQNTPVQQNPTVETHKEGRAKHVGGDWWPKN